MEKLRLLSITLATLFISNVFAQSYYQPDLNGDRFVNFSDFTMLAENWQKSGSSLIGDIDSSGNVDYNDIFLLAEKWLQYSLVIFVDASASAGGDGASWENAFVYLQDATLAADNGYEIWVAQGTYRPDSNSVFPYGTNLHTSIFEIPQGVAIYGGFPTGGSTKQQRDWTNNETILTGDIGTAGYRNDNCYNVVRGVNDVILDGVTIADGNATTSGDNARGGGMINEDVNNLTIANCTFRNNYAKYDGGGIYNYQSSVTLTNCTFSENNCGDDGAGVYNSNSDTTLTNCRFFDNHSVNRGGGIYNYRTAVELINCLFRGNHADSNGGAVYNSYEVSKLTNCTFTENTAGGNSGGIYNTYSASVITNCILWNNANSICKHSCNPHISYCDIQYCGGSGAGWDPNFGTDDGNNIDINPCFTDDLALQSESPCIDAGKNSALPLYITTDIIGNARFNGVVDMGAYEYGQLDMSADSDSDGLLDWWEYRYGLNPNDTNDAQGDIDGDGLSNLSEYNGGCDPIFFDTDGDLLPDGWEVLYGLNPLNSDVVEVVDGNNVYADNDGDGLDTLTEIMFACSPLNSDSDSDGTDDGTEAAQGSLPMDAADLGLAPAADEICELRLTVGDWSSSNSERYDLVVGPITHQATRFGVVETADYRQFRTGRRYEARIVHRGTNPDRTWYPNPDYDYVAQIEAASLPAGVIMQIDDADGILGCHGEPNTINSLFDAAGKVAYVDLIKVQITEPDGNPATDNHFVFDSSSSGVCNVIATGTAGISEKNADLEWLLTAITGSIQTSNPSPPKGSNLTFTYTGLPSSNSEFGLKTLTLTYPTTSQQTTKQVEIFFSRDAYNHSGAGSGITRNWYYYWKEGGVVSDLIQFEYQDQSGYGAYYPSTGNLCVRNQAPTSNIQFTVTNKVNNQVEIIGGTGNGIECCAETCTHELKHKWIHDNWASLPDRDGDGIPDSQEGIPPYYFDPNDPDTYNLVGTVNPDYATVGDQEFLAWKAEQNPGSSDASKDWSNLNGKQWDN